MDGFLDRISELTLEKVASVALMAPVLFLANALGQFSLFVIAEFFIQKNDNLQHIDKWFARIALGSVWFCLAFVPAHLIMYSNLSVTVPTFNAAAVAAMPISIILVGLAYALILVLRRGK